MTDNGNRQDDLTALPPETARELFELAWQRDLTVDAFVRRLIGWFKQLDDAGRANIVGKPRAITADLVQQCTAELRDTVRELTDLYSGPPVEAGTFSDGVLVAVSHLAERVGRDPEKFLRDFVKFFVDRLKLVEQQLEAGLVRLPYGLDFNSVVEPPLPLVSEPSFTVREASEMPEPQENVAWTTRVDWNAARKALDEGKALCFSMDPPDMEAARDAIRCRLGLDLVTRINIFTFELWVVRPASEH